MIRDFVADIEEFHKKFELEYNGKPRLLPNELRWFRERFLNEELNEYRLNWNDIDMSDKADIAHRLENGLDALVDLVYVAIGTAYLHGFDFRTAWRRVHEANMKKVRVNKAELSKRGSSYDVVKPTEWTPPSHIDLVEDHAHLTA